MSITSGNKVTVEARIEQRVKLTIDVPAYIAHRIGNAMVQQGNTDVAEPILNLLLGEGWGKESLRNPLPDEWYPALDGLKQP